MPRNAPPNILFICTDQHRFDTLGCSGNAQIQTPTIDRLAREGVLFERCYVQSPVCAPSRASLMTGRYPPAHGLWANGVTLPPGQPLLTRALAEAGYASGLVGKMHLSACFRGRTELRRDDGLDYFQWAHDPTHGSPENQYHRWLEKNHPDLYQTAMANGPGRSGHEPVRFDAMPTEAHYSHWAAEKAIEFLQAPRNPDTPFFLWLNFFDPHHPFVAPREYLDKYDPEKLPVPIGAPDELTSKPPIYTEAAQASYAGHARSFTAHSAREIQDIIAAYYAMISLIDDEVKRVLATLDEVGLRDDTLSSSPAITARCSAIINCSSRGR